jgi:hypothetical protein
MNPEAIANAALFLNSALLASNIMASRSRWNPAISRWRE